MTNAKPFGRRVGGVLLVAALAAGPACAQDGDEDGFLDVPMPLPESLNGTVRPRERDPVSRIDRIRDVFEALQACWRPPRGSGFTGQEVTVRLSFSRSGAVLGRPRVTFYKAGGEDSDREAFTRSVAVALERCSPLPFTERFAAAAAGRPFTFRFIDSRAL